MREMADARMNSQPWWLSLPGILTAFAGLITAVAGLLIAGNQVGLLQRPTPPVAAPAALTVEFTAKPALSGECSYTVTAARAWRRGDRQIFIKLALHVRNRAKEVRAVTPNDFRLVSEGSALVPVEGPNLSIAPGAGQTGDLVFVVAGAVRAAELRIGPPGHAASIPIRIG